MSKSYGFVGITEGGDFVNGHAPFRNGSSVEVLPKSLQPIILIYPKTTYTEEGEKVCLCGKRFKGSGSKCSRWCLGASPVNPSMNVKSRKEKLDDIRQRVADLESENDG